MDVLRTPDDRFQNLPGYPFAPHYADVAASDTDKIRVHYVDEGQARRSCCSTANRAGVTCTAP